MARAARELNSSEDMVVRSPLRGSHSETLSPEMPVTLMEWRYPSWLRMETLTDGFSLPCLASSSWMVGTRFSPCLAKTVTWSVPRTPS
ncbi:hypothetical protein D3C86_1080070 [compost metagenome]